MKVKKLIEQGQHPGHSGPKYHEFENKGHQYDKGGFNFTLFWYQDKTKFLFEVSGAQVKDVDLWSKTTSDQIVAYYNKMVARADGQEPTKQNHTVTVRLKAGDSPEFVGLLTAMKEQSIFADWTVEVNPKFREFSFETRNT